MIWTPEQVDMVIRVCEGNFKDGEGTIKEVLVEAYEKRKRNRLGQGNGGWAEGGGVDWSRVNGRERGQMET